MEVSDAFEFRMKSIEAQISEINAKIDKLTDAISSARLQDKDTELSLSLLDSRVSKLEISVSDLQRLVADIKNAPDKKDAQRWQQIADYIFKALVAAAVLAVLAKIGLN